LRVDHERPSSRVGDDDAVVDAEVVDRQAGDLPGAHGHCAAERRAQREMRRARDLLADARRVPPGHAVLPTHTQVALIHADTPRHAVPPTHTHVAPIHADTPRHAVLPTHTQVAPIHADTCRVLTRHAVPPAHTQVAPIHADTPRHAVPPTHTHVAPIHADTRRVPTRHAVPPAHTQVAPILPIHRPRHAVLPTDRDTGR